MIYVYECFTYIMPVCGDQNPLKLELEVVVNPHVGAGKLT